MHAATKKRIAIAFLLSGKSTEQMNVHYLLKC